MQSKSPQIKPFSWFKPLLAASLLACTALPVSAYAQGNSDRNARADRRANHVNHDRGNRETRRVDRRTERRAERRTERQADGRNAPRRVRDRVTATTTRTPAPAPQTRERRERTQVVDRRERTVDRSDRRVDRRVDRRGDDTRRRERTRDTNRLASTGERDRHRGINESARHDRSHDTRRRDRRDDRTRDRRRDRSHDSDRRRRDTRTHRSDRDRYRHRSDRNRYTYRTDRNRHNSRHAHERRNRLIRRLSYNYRPYTHRGHHGYRTNYRSTLGISFFFGNTGYSRYRWAPNRYHFYTPGYYSYASYRSRTTCERVLVDALHHGHEELISVEQCYNPRDGYFFIQGTERVEDCPYSDGYYREEYYY